MKKIIPSLIVSSLICSNLLSLEVNVNKIKESIPRNKEIKVINISDIDNSKVKNEKSIDKYPKWAQQKKTIKTSMITLNELLEEVIPEDIYVKIDKEIFLKYSSLVIPNFKSSNQTIGEILDRMADNFDVFINMKNNEVEVKLVDNMIFQLPLSNGFETKTDIQIGADTDSSGSNSKISSSTTLETENFDVIKENLTSLMEAASDTSGIPHYFLSNKDTGILNVTGTRSTLKKLESYIKEIIEANTRVVLLEAKILKFSNSDSKSFGIKWNDIFNTLNLQGLGTMSINALKPSIGDTSNQIALGNPYSTDGSSTTVMKLGSIASPDAIINALDRQGDVETVAEPTLRINNNQATTVFSGVVKSYVSNVSSTTDENGGTATTLEVNKLEEGFNMTIKPRINKDTNEIELFMVPVLNTLVAMNSQSADGVEVKLPIVDSRSMNLSTKIKNGETLILAGLKEKGSNNVNSGVPILSKIPVINNLFGYKEKISTQNELVIIIKAQVLK